MNYLLSKILIYTFCVFALFSCNSDSGSNDKVLISPVSNLKLYDVENSGTSTDILIEFTKSPDESDLDEYRIFLVKSSSNATLDLLLTLGSNSFVSVEPENTNQYSVRLNELTLDTDGEVINTDISYKAIILTVASVIESSSVSLHSSDLQLKITNLVDTIAEDIPAGTGGLSLDADGNIYLGDFGETLNGGGNRVIKIAPDGTFVEFATGLNGASGNDFDLDGNLYQSNISNSTISKITPEGVVEEYISQNSLITSPVGIIVDEDLNLLVTNCGSASIAKVDAQKNIELIAGPDNIFNCPNGIAQDDDGNLYITNFQNSNIIKISSDGVVSLFKTLPGDQITHPFYSNGYLYAVSRGDSRIYRISIATGVEEVVAGSGSVGFRDGAALDAEFTRPNDIVITPDGKTIYINDTEFTAAQSGLLGPVVIRRIRLFE